MSRDDHNATELHLRWAAVLASWIVCNPTDRGAVKFVRAETAASAEPVRRYWTVTMDGKITGDHLGQHGMLSETVYATTAEEAERLALECAEGATELKVLFTRPS